MSNYNPISVKQYDILHIFPSVLHTDISAPEPLSPAELEVLSHLIEDWNKLASHLSISEEKVKKIEAANMKEWDCCRELLEGVAAERMKIFGALEDMKYCALADSLLCGTLTLI